MPSGSPDSSPPSTASPPKGSPDSMGIRSPRHRQRTSSTGVAPGGTAYLGRRRVGTGLTYQWFKNGNPLTDGGNISGSTTAILTISNASAGDDADYTVAVTGGSPVSTVTSSPAHLYLLGAPLIVAQPAPTWQSSSASPSPLRPRFSPPHRPPISGAGTVSPLNSANDQRIDHRPLSLPSAARSQTGTYTLTITNSQGTATTSRSICSSRPLPSRPPPTPDSPHPTPSPPSTPCPTAHARRHSQRHTHQSIAHQPHLGPASRQA